MNTILQRAAHSTELSLSDGKAPEWIHVLPTGTFTGRDGRGPYTLDDPERVIAATMSFYGNADLPMDYDHQIELATQNGQPAPASGWVKGFEARTDGLWARVEWTEKAASHITAREYRYVSPVFYFDKAGRIGRLESVALTNRPNLELKALATITTLEVRMDLNSLASVLGVSPESATPALLETRLRAVMAERDAASATLAEVGKTVQSAGFGADDVLKAVQATVNRATAPDPARYVPVDVYSAATRELAELKSAHAANQAAALVEEAGKAGKVTPAMEAWAKDYAASNPVGFKAWAAAAPDLRPGNGGGSSAPPENGNGKNGEELTGSQKAVCSAMGFTTEDYKKAGGVHG